MDLKKVQAMPPADQIGYLQNAIIDYRCKIDSIPIGLTELPWVTTTIGAIDADQQSIFVEGRWLFLRDVEWRPNGGQQLKRVVAPIPHDDRRDSANTASDETKREMRRIIPGPVKGAANTDEFNK